MRLLREPLLHFLVLGAAMFFLLSPAREDRPVDAERRIVVTPEHVRHLVTGFTRAWQRAPTPGELDGLIDDHVREEVYYREALTLQLDRDDTIVRRRLREKMEFLVEDVSDTQVPSDETLAAFLAEHPEAYRVEPRLSFRQVLIDPEARARGTGDLLQRLSAGGEHAETDGIAAPRMLPGVVDRAERREVAGLFGEPFTTAVEQLETGRWSGPIESGYGMHLVYLRERVPGGSPPLHDVRDAVERDWYARERKAMVDAAFARLRGRYAVVVERPSDVSPAPAR
jgi:hypothetical protein